MSSETGKVFTFSWKITNFSSCSLKNEEFLQSPMIVEKMIGKLGWRLLLYPRGIYPSNAHFISLFIRRYKFGDCLNEILLTSFKFEIEDPEGRSLKSNVCAGFSVGNLLGFANFIKNDELTSYMEKWDEDTLNVHCHAYITNYIQPTSFCKAYTEIQVQKYLFDWDIAMPPSDNWEKNIVYSFEEENEFNLTLNSSDNKIYLKIEVPKKQKLPEQCKLKITMSGIEKSDDNLKKKSFLLRLSDFETSFEKQEVCHNTNFTSNTSFKLICTILIGNGTVSSSFISCSKENTSNSRQPLKQTTPVNAIDSVEEGLQKLTHHRTLQDDFKDMFLEKKHCDVKIRLDNETIPTHKCLLAARSPVFATMFDQEMVESQTGIVDIMDCDTETFRLFLEFLYTDTITNTDCEVVLKLMLVADKYQVSVLKDKCSEMLVNKISLDNVCEVIFAADLVNQSDLKLFALDYIKANKKDIISSTIWSEWVKNNMALGIEIFTKITVD